MFPELPSFSADEAFLFALGRAGGLCDCRTEEDDDGSLGSEAAGWPFFGQFIAHDITADRSTIRHHVDAAALTNARTPQLNLECLYGDGPIGQPFLFRRDDAAKLLLSRDANDVQRKLRERQSSATHGTIRTSSCRRCISRSRGRTTDSSMPHACAVLRTQTCSPTPASCAGTIREPF